MADDQNTAPDERWHGSALDVRGPGGAGRRGAAGLPFAQTAGDRGALRVSGGLLSFSGERTAWSVPLGWLGDPETDLAGFTAIRLRTADRGGALRLRLAGGGADARALGQVIAEARLAPPDTRDRGALDDLLAILRPEMQALGLWPAAGEQETTPPSPIPAFGNNGVRALAAAARLHALWLPYWGVPASRLRTVTVGALIAAGEAAQDDADAETVTRCLEATRRWQNVVEDLRVWCELSAADLPAGRWPTPQEHATSVAPLVDEPEADALSEPAAAAPATQPAATAPPAARPPLTTASAPLAAAPPVAPPPTPIPPAPIAAREPRPADEEDQGTMIIPARNLPPHTPSSEPVAGGTLVITTPGPRPPLGGLPAQLPAQSPAPVAPAAQGAPASATQPPPPPPAAPPNPAEVYDDRTIIAGPGRFSEEMPPPTAPTTPPPPPAQPATPVAPVVSGPGRGGSGGMTLLYRHAGPGGSIARKELQPADAARPEVVETFLNIGRRFGAVQHPNFVRILNLGREPDSGLPYIDMEFVEGEVISARYGRGPVPPAQALQIVDQLAGAIDAIHRAGLVHGDVRPQNVLVEPAPGGRVVLLDPSVACDHALEYQRGSVYGDLSYLTPERARGDAQGSPADLYMLATFAFMLLAGRPPFLFSGDPIDIFNKHIEEPAPLLDSLLPGAPPAAAAVIGAGLAKRPDQRPTSALAFAADLRRAFGMSSLPPRAEGATQPAGWTAPPQPPTPLPPVQQTPPPAPQRGSPSPLGGGRPAPSPLGRPAPPTPPPPTGKDDPPDDMDKTVIVRPR